MLTVENLNPFYVKRKGDTLHFVFAYKYLVIKKGDVRYFFIPIEDKEILVDVKTKQVKNLSDVFVFQSGNKFMRLPLYQFLVISNVSDYLTPAIEEALKSCEEKEEKEDFEMEEDEEYGYEENEEDVKNIQTLLLACEEQNLRCLIDQALDERDEALFKQLTKRLVVRKKK